MKKLILAILFFASLSHSAGAAQLNVKLEGFEDGGPMPERFANCVATGSAKSSPGENISPAISWENGPEGTKSYAIIMVDRDVPASFADANQDDKVIKTEAERQNFYHWMLINIPTNVTSLPEGAGKNKNYGRMLINDYLKFSGLKKNPQNIKKFSGYDGPCPPFNDERVHYYHFKVYALSDRFVSGDNYTGDDITLKITPYILAYGEVIGSYTLNPALAPKKKAVSAKE